MYWDKDKIKRQHKILNNIKPREISEEERKRINAKMESKPIVIKKETKESK